MEPSEDDDLSSSSSNHERFMYSLDELVSLAKSVENNEIDVCKLNTQTEKPDGLTAQENVTILRQVGDRDVVVIDLLETAESNNVGIRGEQDVESGFIRAEVEDQDWTTITEEENNGDGEKEVMDAGDGTTEMETGNNYDQAPVLVEIDVGHEVEVQSTEFTEANNGEVLTGKPVAQHKRAKAKLARLEGKQYVGFRRVDKKKTNLVKQDSTKSERKMGAGCEQQKCEQWAKRQCKVITEEERKQNFDMFWKLPSWEMKKTLVWSLVTRKQLNTEFVEEGQSQSRRGVTYYYHLHKGKSIVQVCRKMFMDTLGIGEGMVKRWLAGPEKNPQTSVSTSHEPSTSQLTTNLSKTGLVNRITHAEEFLKSIPTLPSHYCRRESSKVYLQGDIASKQDLFVLYKADCLKDRISPLSRTKFLRLMDQANIGIFKPRKDQCDLCCSYQNKNIAEEVYLEHLKNKDRARAEKENDKAAANNKECHVLTCDLMNVQCVPYIRASAAFYKLKLAVHNYTVYNIESHDAMNYWWDETVTTLDASTYASCLESYIEEMMAKEYRPVIIIYSDGCTAQNRNSILANALLHLSARLNVRIIQKYLVKGHTQMEGDSVHATVEAGIRQQNIYLPSTMLTITELARKPPRAPYRATYLKPHMVKDFSQSVVYTSIRPGKKKNDPVLTNVHWLEYDGKKSAISYKLNFDDPLQPLPKRPAKRLHPEDPYCFPPKGDQIIPIPYDKWKDLQSLKPMIPQDCHGFYDDLPHQPDSLRQQKRAEKNEKKGAQKSKN